MSYWKSNGVLPYKGKEFTAEDLKSMTQSEFDRLSYEEVLYICRHFHDEYLRLTGQAVPTDTSPTPQNDTQRAKTAVDEYEKMLDRIFERVDSEHT